MPPHRKVLKVPMGDIVPLFDHLVGADKERGRDREAEGFRIVDKHPFQV
jgi:hypothetical protein